jgi:DnaK suppressor protein
MSLSKPMSLSKKDLEALRKALEARRAELLRAREEHLAAGIHSDEESRPDPMDAATRSEDEAELVGLAEQERLELEDIDRALAKIDSGTYGVSELSGRPIPIERLRAVPWARLTADEEEKLERR